MEVNKLCIQVERSRRTYLLNRVLRHVPHYGNRLILSHAVRPGDSLVLYGRVPLRLDNVNTRRCRHGEAIAQSVRQVDIPMRKWMCLPDGTYLQGHQENSYCGLLLKPIEIQVPLGSIHPPVNLDISYAP